MGSGVEIHGAYQQFQLRKLFLRSVGHRSRFHFCNPNKTKYRAGQKCTPNTDIIDICFYHWQKPLLLISVLGVNFRPTLYYWFGKTPRFDRIPQKKKNVTVSHREQWYLQRIVFGSKEKNKKKMHYW